MTTDERLLLALLRVRVALGPLQEELADMFPHYPDVRAFAEEATAKADTLVAWLLAQREAARRG